MKDLHSSVCVCVYVKKAKSYERFAVSYPEMGIAWTLFCYVPFLLRYSVESWWRWGPIVEERTLSEELLGLTGWVSEAKGFLGFGFPERMARRTNLALCAACIN